MKQCCAVFCLALAFIGTPSVFASSETESGCPAVPSDQTPDKYSVRKDIRRSVGELLSAGPNRWVELPTAPTGKYIFQRGLSGVGAHDGGGLIEAFTLLSGKPEPRIRYVTHVSTMDLSTRFAHFGNSHFSDPLTVRGKADFFVQNSPYPPPPIEVLPALKAYSDWQGPEHLICPGYTIDMINALGLFTPRPPYGVWVGVGWAKSYLLFVDELAKLQIVPAKGSRGEKFYWTIKDYLSATKEPGDEIFEIFDFYGAALCEGKSSYQHCGIE